MYRRLLAGVATALILATIAGHPAEARDVRPWLGWTTNTIEQARETEVALGRSPAALSTYADFTDPFPQSWADETGQRGIPLVVAWEPWDSDLPLGADQPEYSLAAIASGAYDAYARVWARAAASSGAVVLLRFAPEMNGDWHAWSIGDTPAEFRRAWRHLHDVFSSEGASNVKWVFNPSVSYEGSTAIASFWPGAAYVDWLAMDGYNWAGVLPGRPYESVATVFSATSRQLRALSRELPMMIAECGAGPGAKDTWIPDLMATAPRLGVRLVVWFEHVKETDWRMTTAQY